MEFRNFSLGIRRAQPMLNQMHVLQKTNNNNIRITRALFAAHQMNGGISARERVSRKHTECEEQKKIDTRVMVCSTACSWLVVATLHETNRDGERNFFILLFSHLKRMISISPCTLYVLRAGRCNRVCVRVCMNRQLIPMKRYPIILILIRLPSLYFRLQFDTAKSIQQHYSLVVDFNRLS